MSELVEMMEQNAEENTGAEYERFHVDNDMKAEWCLNKIRGIRAEQKREKDELQRQMQFYLDQMEIVDKKADENAAFFEEMLKGYFVDRVDEGFTKATKTQITYKLPTGVLKLKKQQPSIDYKTHQADTIEWLKQNGFTQFIKTKEELAWSDLKKNVTIQDGAAVTADGEIIPGIEVTEREDVFEVEVN